MDILFFLQETITGAIQDGAGITTPTVQAPVGNFSVMDQLIKGWYIYVPQLIMSIIAVYVIIERTLTVIKKAIENVGKLETAKLDRNVTILATIAGIAPVFGFLGTVFGVITIFRDIAEAGSLQIGTVSEGLYLKMISSAVGLIVFMIAYIGYNTLVTRINKVVNKMEANAVEFMDILEQPTN